jgi:DNA polymerase III delta prime subunit
LIIIDEGDRLPRKAQQALTGPMQHFRASIRVVITTNNASRLIPSLRSRCRPIAVSPPPVSERVRVLAQLALAEGLEYDEEALAAFAEPFHDLRQMIYAAQAWALEQGSLRVAPSSDGGGWDHGSGQIVLPLGDRP